MNDLSWVEKTTTVFASDPAKDTIEENPAWKLLHVGQVEGEVALTYGWPWEPPVVIGIDFSASIMELKGALTELAKLTSDVPAS